MGPRDSVLVLLAATAAGCTAAAAYGVGISDGPAAVWWPAAGLGAGLTIVAPRRWRVAVASSAGAADTVVSLLADAAPGAAVVSGLLAALQCLLVAAAWDRAVPSRVPARQTDLARYVVATAAAVTGAAVVRLALGVAFPDTTSHTMTASAADSVLQAAGAVVAHAQAQVIGVLIVATPIVLWSARRELAIAAGVAERVGYLLVTVTVTAAVFWPAGYGHLAYLALLPLLAAGLRCGPFWSSLCLAAAATVSVATGEPVPAGAAPLLPTFLAVATGATLVLATAVQQRRRTERDLAVALAEAEATARDFEAFSYAVAHDLRTPLRAIDGFGHALATDHAADLSPQALALLERVRTAARYMGQLVDGLLMLARMSRVQLSVELADISSLAADSVDRLRAADPDRQVSVTIAPGARAAVDPPLFSIVLDNLIGNAWKFTAATPEPHIEVGWQKVDDGTEVWVTDNGMGFDMDYSDKLFKPFQRLHSTAEAAGAGLGLATTATIVDRHGGTIRAGAGVGKGATFTVVLPSPREPVEE